MYQPLSIRGGTNPTQATTFMGAKGVNGRDLPQLLDPSMALTIDNYLVTADGQLAKRKGQLEEFSVAGTDPITMIIEWDADTWIFAYAFKVAAYTLSTDTVTDIKTDFTVNDTFSGQRYGGYFFVSNGNNGIVRISRTIDYGTQTANFTVGARITGATSGATATILEDSDGGATGTLTIGNITGTFQSGEIITDNGSPTGSATTTSVVEFVDTVISAAPKAKVLKVIGARLFAGNIEQDEASVAYSGIDDGSNPPFDNWTVAAAADDPGLASYRNAGTVNAIDTVGEFVVVFSEKGKWAFYINTVDSAGTLTKIDVFQMTRIDFGGSRATISTNQGLFYANEAGLWQLVSVGQQNIKFSDQEALTSVLLGDKFFDNVDLSNAAIEYDAKARNILLSIAKNSDTNNLILVYNIDTKAFSTISAWNINRFMNIDQVIYGGSATSTKVDKLFIGTTDNGASIGTNFLQELQLGNLETKQMLLGCYIQGFLSASSDITVRFDIYDITGKPIKDKLRFSWTAQRSENGFDGYGTANWGISSWGGDVDFANLIESFDGCRPFIRNFQRVRVHITSGDKLQHVINWVSLEAKVKSKIRRRKMTAL
tara:strand:+ start:750 stop:2543 length:1794 start_codon:yes stop_codon:yes gene_type:complete